MEKTANDSNTSKKRLLGLTTAELKQVAQQLGMPAFTGGQIAKWLYEKGVMSIDEMTNLSKVNRERLAAMVRLSTCFLFERYVTTMSQKTEPKNLSRPSSFLTATVPHFACHVRWAAR